MLLHLNSPCTPQGIDRPALFAVLMLMAAAYALAVIFGDPIQTYFSVHLVGFGIIFGWLWGLASRWIYRAVCHDFHTQSFAV